MTSDQNTDKLEKRLDSVDSRLDMIDANLDKHMKRSDSLEAQVAPMLELHRDVKFVIKMVKFIGVLCTILECVRFFWS